VGKVVKQIVKVLKAYGEATAYLLKPGYRNYLLLPILVNLVFLVAVIWAALHYAEPLLKWSLGLFKVDLSTWHGAFSAAAIVALQLLSFALFLSIYKYLVLIVLAPFLAFLSEKVEKDVAGKEFPFSWGQFAADIGRALRINAYNLFREIGLTLIFTILGFIPLVGLLSPFAILALQSYFYGYGVLDYNAERWRYSFSKTENYMRQNWGLALGVGAVFHLLFLIPFLGWVVAPIWAVIAGTLAVIQTRPMGHLSAKNPIE
jgi:CysZ protein